MHWYILDEQIALEMGTEPEPHPESKIWRLTEFEAGSGVLVFGDGSEFGVNFSYSAHLCDPL